MDTIKIDQAVAFMYFLAWQHLKDNLCDEAEVIKVGKLEMSLTDARNTILSYLEK